MEKIKPKHILVIDDSRTTRNYHAQIVRSGGFSVDTAMDGAEGLEKLFSSQVDLVLTDINMQGMDGYEFCRRARANQEFTRLPIIIVSTEAGQADKMRGFAAGADYYIIKPAAPDDILAQIKMFFAPPASISPPS